MAQKVTTHLIDDVTGDIIEDGAGRTVRFAFDGSNYEIDLTDGNVDNLRDAFSRYIAAARKLPARGARTAAVKGRSNPDELAKIRSWALANGYEVAARGRISQQVRDAYDAAN